MTTWLIALTIGLPWLGGLLVWLVGNHRPGWQHSLAAIFSISSGITALMLISQTSAEAAISIPLGGIFGDFTFVSDGLGVFIAAIAAVVGCLAVVFSIDYMREKAQLGRYYSLVLLFIGAMSGLALSGSLLLMFIFWEMTAFCSYALISFHSDNPKAVAGGIKALIMTQLGGAGLLAGALMAYANLGSYQIDSFLAESHQLPAQTLGLMAFGFLVAAAAKSAQVPFHTWLPDAMEAPTPVTALIHAATMVNAGVYLLARFYPAFESVPGWRTAVVSVGLLSSLLAGGMALVANDLKRALAYSTISQLGYLIYAVGASAIFASQFHLLSHAVFKALLFLSAGAVITSVGTRDMRTMGGLGKQMPFVRIVFLIGALGLVGLPIANGFFSKELILENGLQYGPTWAYIGMLIGSGLTAIYTLRMVWLIFYGENHGTVPSHDAKWAMRMSLGVLAAGTLTTWLLAGGLSQLLAMSLPFHHLESDTTGEVVVEILTAPATWVALMVVVAGLTIYWQRKYFASLTRLAYPLIRFAQNEFGFEWLNQQVIQLTRKVAVGLQITQTGQLNWNLLGILAGLVIMLLLMVQYG